MEGYITFLYSLIRCKKGIRIYIKEMKKSIVRPGNFLTRLANALLKKKSTIRTNNC